MDAKQLLGEGWLAVVHPEDRERVLQEWQRALKEQTSSRIQLRFRRADGQYLWYTRSVIPYQDGQGNLLKWVGINSDIQEQKLKEMALQENELLKQTQQKLLAEKDFLNACSKTVPTAYWRWTHKETLRLGINRWKR